MTEAYTAFNADVLLLPQWVQIWMRVLVVVLVASTIVLLIGKQTRNAGLYLLVTTPLMSALMVWMHSQLGMVRLLGFAHMIFWLPFVAYAWNRLRANPPAKLYAAVMAVLALVMALALVFDIYDVARWLGGERAPIV